MLERPMNVDIVRKLLNCVIETNRHLIQSRSNLNFMNLFSFCVDVPKCDEKDR